MSFCLLLAYTHTFDVLLWCAELFAFLFSNEYLAFQIYLQ